MAGHIQSAGNISWNTPGSLIERFKAIFGGGIIDLDPCSNDESLVGAITNFKLPETNGLEADWSPYKRIFINPPFGRTHLHKETNIAISAKEFKVLDKKARLAYKSTTIWDWVNKSLLRLDLEFNTDSEQILLIPAAVGTQHWQRIIFPAREYGKCAKICFIEGRLKFVGAADPAPMDIALVGMSRNKEFLQQFEEILYDIGRII
jgi:hypothetical protein